MARIQEFPLEILRCPACKRGTLSAQTQPWVCASCHETFPLINERFPDFLTPSDREKLKEELHFWEEHEANHPGAYQDESESSYQKLAAWMNSSENARVLDIGCGSGALLKRIPSKTKMGVEPSENLLKHAEGFFGVISTAGNLPFQDGSFDLVFFKHSLHHVQDKSAAIQEAARVLKKGGRLIVIEPNADHPQRRMISDPNSAFRRHRILTRFIGPVETFQTLDEVVREADRAGLQKTRQVWFQSDYDQLTLRQFLQRAYAWFGRLILPAKWVYPNYFLEFIKA